jgi:hypothetical protein
MHVSSLVRDECRNRTVRHQVRHHQGFCLCLSLARAATLDPFALVGKAYTQRDVRLGSGAQGGVMQMWCAGPLLGGSC